MNLSDIRVVAPIVTRISFPCMVLYEVLARVRQNDYQVKVREAESQAGEAKSGVDCEVIVPEGATLHRDEFGAMELAWDDLHGRRHFSGANEVWSLANLGLHGFRFVSEPAVIARHD